MPVARFIEISKHDSPLYSTINPLIPVRFQCFNDSQKVQLNFFKLSQFPIITTKFVDDTKNIKCEKDVKIVTLF